MAQVTENALNNDAVNLTQIPMSVFIEKAVASDLKAAVRPLICAPSLIPTSSALCG